MDSELVRAHLEQVERHVVEGQRHISSQLALIGRLQRGGRDTSGALALLAIFERTQALHLADRERLRVELRQDTPGASPSR